MRFCYKMNLLFAMMLILVVSGCRSLPDGNPPTGAIVDPFKVEEQAMSESAAVNYMITSISMRCAPVANSGGKGPLTGMRFNNSDDPLARTLPEQVFKSLIKMSLIKYEASMKAEYYMVSELKKEINAETKAEVSVWQMKFVSADGQKEFWRENVTLKRDSAK